MGLNVTAYTEIEFVETLPDSEDWEEKYWSNPDTPNTSYIHPGYIENWFFGESAGNLIPRGVYRHSDKFDFCAGSYSGYNEWREWLCRLALSIRPEAVWRNPERYEDKPFYHLINFSDCEGYIGTEFAKRLARDFADYQDKADMADGSNWLKAKYAEWRKAFELAANNGYVSFR